MIGSRVNDILIFLSVVEAGSFVDGGRSFGLSRSAAGKAVARLEEGYGARLLNRTTRSLDMTEEGRRLYDQGLAIRDAIAAADASVTSTAGNPSGTLRITAPDALGRRLVLPTVHRFLQTWPNTKVIMGLSDRVDNLVDTGFDLAIRVGAALPDTSFISRVIWKDSPILCASPAYLAQRDRPTTIEHLTRHDLLHFSSRGARQGWRLREDNGHWVQAQGRGRLSLDSAEALREAAQGGAGIALLPSTLVSDDIEQGRLERVLSNVDCGEVPIVALYPHKRLLEPRVRRFIDLLIDDLGG